MCKSLHIVPARGGGVLTTWLGYIANPNPINPTDKAMALESARSPYPATLGRGKPRQR
ncbi:expressed unknown protein [Ectocarpus siliculosus]|uniref:Uncharacterized protein n=1 Tax=Ectocarpus siliculosus TaxID=2880 RepID=D8LLU1_ECTSI|nr:expressed unknown protein [Ectocarpus siliculosus]|eukprot:CBN76177.1 expressed unknown protein [Ectocarpus siliculosus]